jgi:triacylglycerol lipase
MACPATLLVPGWSDTPTALRRAESFLVASGWPENHVARLGFRDRYGSNLEHAVEIAAAVERLRERSGEEAVAIVAHSMGGLATRCWLVQQPAAPVHIVIFAGTPHHGTWLAWLAWGGGGMEMRPGSSFLRGLATSALPSHIRTHCIRTRFDTRVLPGRSAFLEGATAHVVGLPGHPRMLRHLPTLRLIRRLLLGEA